MDLPLPDEILAWGPVGLHPTEPGEMDIFQLKQTRDHRVTLMGRVDVDVQRHGAPDRRYVLCNGNSTPSGQGPPTWGRRPRGGQSYGEEAT